MSIFFYLGIYFIYISNAIPKDHTPLPHPLSHPATSTFWPWHSPVLRQIKLARPMGLFLYKSQVQVNLYIKVDTLKLIEEKVGKSLEDMGTGGKLLNKIAMLQLIL